MEGEKLNTIIMKRRKVTGLILIISTFIYFIACLLALYQNQRVKMEKEIEEALKTYSNQENLNVKELSKDFNLRLDEMVNKEENKKQILKFEGSFERMEKNFTDVTDEMAIVEYNINNLDDRLSVVENFNNELYVELTEKYDLYDVQFNEIQKNTIEIQNTLEELDLQIIELKKQIQENDNKQNKNTEAVQLQLDELRLKVVELFSNALMYQFDADSQTLIVYGDKESEENENE